MKEVNIRYLLYAHPLFEHAPAADDVPLELLIGGLTGMSVPFLREALPLAVIRPAGVHVRLICIGKEQEALFDQLLRDCPALTDFFTVNGVPAAQAKKPFGSISLLRGSTLKTALHDALASGPAHYIYISAATDSTALHAAAVCTKQNILTVTELRKTPEQFPDDPYLVPFCPSAAPGPDSAGLLAQLERMARNLHWIWSSTPNSYVTTEKEYDSYRHLSSLAAAAAVQYKLKEAFGIDLRTVRPADAAAAVKEAASQENSEEIVDLLGWTEHRRWCTEKILAGFTAWEQYDAAARTGTAAASGAPRHLCLRESLRDSEIFALHKKRLQDIPAEQWYQTDPGELADPLDLMTLQLRMEYRRLIAQIRTRNTGELENSYHRIIEGFPEDSAEMLAFRNWKYCIERMLNGDADAAVFYKEAKNRLSDCCSEVGRAHIAVIDDVLKPVRESYQYKDYRKIDRDFAANLPHVLTYSDDLTIAVPVSPASCQAGNVTALFHNIAAVYALEPKAALLLIQLSGPQEWDSVQYFLKRADAFFLHKEFRTEITAHIYAPEHAASRITLKRITVKYHKAPHFADAAAAAERTLRQLKTDRYAVQYRRSCALSGALAAKADTIPHFMFDPAARRFSALRSGRGVPECAEMFDYLREIARPLLIEDIALLCDVSITLREQPDYTAFSEEVFALFQSDPDSWKTVCWMLSHCRNINTYFNCESPETEKTCYTHTVPANARIHAQAVSEALRLLADAGMAEQCRMYTAADGSQNFEMELRADLAKSMDYLFYCAEQYDGGSAHYNSNYDMGPDGQRICVSMSALTERVRLTRNGKDNYTAQNVLLLKNYLAKLKEIGCVARYSVAQNDIYVTYPSHQMKDLLTKEGTLFEMFLFAKLYRHFDRLISSVEICWENNTRNEIDLLGIRGFETTIIEAKARKKLDESMIYKIACVARQFTTDPQVFLLAYTEDQDTRLPQIGEAFDVSLVAGNDLHAVRERIFNRMGIAE